MNGRFIFILTVYINMIICGSVFVQSGYAIGERTVSIGGALGWNSAEKRTGIIEAAGIRSNSVLMLSSAPGLSGSGYGYTGASGVFGIFSPLTDSSVDMYVSFDDRILRDAAGNYRIKAETDIERVDRVLARGGTGALIFGGSGDSLTIEPQSRNALFASGNLIGDFTIEFWMCPFNMENGERVFSWVSSVSHNGSTGTQRIQSVAFKNRLQWSFTNFFTQSGSTFFNLEISGNTAIVPKTWSHHLIRFDAKTGMLEYLVNGNSEAIVYATKTRRESSEVFTPVAGNGGFFQLGENFKGFFDELKIHNAFAGRSLVQKYPFSGGRIESSFIDTGELSSQIVRVDATGGKISNSHANEFRENGNFKFSDDTQMQFFIRTSENPWTLNGKPWIAFIPGEDMPNLSGRYAQIAVDFYPSADGETSPYLEQISVIYLLGEPPHPPQNVNAVAVDGGVILRWKHSPDVNIDGYLIYYSSVRGELFGRGADLGHSPIDAGMTNNILITGLQNGTLYYFKVAGYDELINGSYHTGEFSAEVTARPLTQLKN